jgi:hypothetical protein
LPPHFGWSDSIPNESGDHLAGFEPGIAGILIMLPVTRDYEMVHGSKRRRVFMLKGETLVKAVATRFSGRELRATLTALRGHMGFRRMCGKRPVSFARPLKTNSVLIYGIRHTRPRLPRRKLRWVSMYPLDSGFRLSPRLSGAGMTSRKSNWRLP